MLGLILPLVSLICLLTAVLLFESVYNRKPSLTLEKQVYLELAKIEGPVYLDATLLLKLKSKLKRDSINISECICILRRQGKIQKTYIDNRRSLLIKSFDRLPEGEDMLTLVILKDTLYLVGDNPNSWKAYDDWVINLHSS